MRNVVNSTSVHKVDPFRIYSKERSWDPASVITCKASSGGPEQPHGFKQAMDCVLNRHEDGRRLEPNADYMVSAESYLEWDTIRGYEWALDQAIVLVQNKWGKVVTATSPGIEVPLIAVKRAYKLGFDKHTVGSVIAQMYGEAGDDGTDIQDILTRDKSREFLIRRSETMLIAFRMAFAIL